MISCIYWVVHLKVNHQISEGDIVLVLTLNLQMIERFHGFSHQLREFIIKWGGLNKALEDLDLPLQILDHPQSTSLISEKGKITFDNISFAYPEALPLFQNLSLEISPQQKVGLVGYSGGGKSTFVNLILRLFEIESGKIQIDDQDIKLITQNSLRTNIAFIPQEPSLFHRTLMENIRYGNLEATDEQVMEAARKAHAHEFIEKLINGYDSLVGERGIKLSGGQRQRIAIARAILKDAPILILDEATSQLDSLTEQKIQKSLLDLMSSKTTLVIAHRLSTLLHMDRILVFDKGKIIEDGSHQELLSCNSLYKTLWETQVSGFLPNNP